MNDVRIDPLSPDPADWKIVDMWGFVNAVCEACESGPLRNGEPFVAALGHGDAPPVWMAFSRPALVAEMGWSWENHYGDEQVAIEFRTDGPIIHICRQASNIIISRFVAILAIIRNFSNRNEVAGKTVLCSVGDSDGDMPILAFSSRKHSEFLIPDPYFILTRSYEEERAAFDSGWLDYAARDPRFYWRGAPSGLGKYEDQFESQRVKLVLMANRGRHREDLNVKFANNSGLNHDVCSELEKASGFSPFEDQMEIARYRYNIDVDGVSSSWTGFFLKLLAGGTVVKIKSDQGFRQWYYPELKPWVHYVEVAEDLTDFRSIIRMLNIRTDWAAEVAEAGRSFALSLDLRSQLDKSSSAIWNALSSGGAQAAG